MFPGSALCLTRVRTTIKILAGLFASLFAWDHALGQGTFYFQNSYLQFGVDAPVFDAVGNRLEGPSYMAMLYGAATEDSLQPIVPAVSFLSGINAGYFGGGVRAVNGVLPGQEAWLEVRAWDARLGSTYEAVVALGIGGYGQSSLFHAQSGGIGGGVPTLPAPLIGLQSFSLVPEPSAVVLLLLGLPLLLLRKRRLK
jgi:hypothetical protein